MAVLVECQPENAKHFVRTDYPTLEPVGTYTPFEPEEIAGHLQSGKSLELNHCLVRKRSFLDMLRRIKILP